MSFPAHVILRAAAVLIVLVAPASGQPPVSDAAPAQSPPGGSPSKATAIPDKLAPIPLDQIKVAGEMGRRIKVTIENSLLNLEVERDFLKPFREKKTTNGYTGLGLLIDASIRFAVHSQDPRVLAYERHLVKTLLEAQESDGYLGEFERGHRMWPFIDIQELAYLIHALVADHRAFKEERSLLAARRQADYILEHWKEKPADWPLAMGCTFHMFVTNLERALYMLFEETGDRRYRDFCVEELGVKTWDLPIVVGRFRPLEGHIHSYLSRAMAQVEWHRHEPGEALLAPARRALDFMLQRDGMDITGGCGDLECWHDSQTGTVNSKETCSTVYILKFLDSMLRLEGDSLYGDVMERTIFNALFSAQSPDGRKMRYFTPFDGPRVYCWTGDTYCCPNQYRRGISQLPEWIYYRTGDGVAVNLYTASSARLELDGGLKLSIAQETDYPTGGEVTLRIDPERASEFSVSLRIPRWCADPAISVNGEATGDTIRSGTFFSLRRTWKPGDRIQVRLPMRWRFVKGRQAQAGKVAVMRGPLLFGLSRSRFTDLKANAPMPPSGKWLASDGLPGSLGLLTIDTASIQGPVADRAVRPDGMGCKVRAWQPGAWFDLQTPDVELHLTELPDPDCEGTYFSVPNPFARGIVEDEILAGRKK
jgi:DUF1680 family protein